MKISTTRFNEKKRLEAIQKYHILDTEDEQDYDDIVELASHVCRTPIAVITFLDDKRQWFKAKKGLSIRETDIQISFCAHTVNEDDMMIVNDTIKDHRFFNNPLVTTHPNIRFYAGVPLKMPDGVTIGTVAIADTKPRDLTANQVNSLKILAGQVVRLLTIRLENLELNKNYADKSKQVLDILDRVSDAFIAVDRDWSITFINEKAATITGRIREKVLGKNLWHEFPETFSSLRFPELTQEAFSKQTEQFTEEFFEPYNVWLETRIFPSPTGLSIYFKDITERKNAENALKESEANYRRLIEGNPQPMWIYSTEDLRILEVNEAAITKYGYSREEFLKLAIVDLRPEVEITKLHDFLKQSGKQRKGYTQSGPWKHLLKNGTVIDVEITSHEILWEGKKARFTMAWDVTRRLQMEDSLRVAEEQYRSIFENATDAIYQSTPEGKFITANPAMASMFGYDSPEALMNAVTDIGEQLYADADKRLELKSMLEKDGFINGLELRMIRRNGEVIWARVNVRVIKDSRNNVLYFEGTLDDITHRREAEEKLRYQFEELQKTNQELDRFVYSVSHDLRAPLSTILGLIHVAELESPSKMFNEYLKMIKTNIKRLDGFINDILDYSLNARKEVQVALINFHQLIDGIVRNFNFLPSADRLKVNIDIRADVPFYSDGHRLTIVLNNLLTNAIKYQDFTKSDSFVSITIVATDENAILRISDNGIGIAKSHLDKIFNMFYRASENSKGSGLGLYIAKETVTKLGGTIRVESEFGASTAFELNIPNLKSIHH